MMSKKEELSKEIEEDKSSLDGIISEYTTLNRKIQDNSCFKC